MKEEEDSYTVVSIPTRITATSTVRKESSSSVSSDNGSLFRKSRYKFWVFAAILLLAFWSMFTGSVTLKWSTTNLSPLSHDVDFPLYYDLDVLEVEEKEKVVRHMWSVYKRGSSIPLPKFWQQAFQAAYEALTSDVAAVREATITEIAKMSILSISLDPSTTTLQSETKAGKKSRKKADKIREPGSS